jgi:hypothetical protein
VETKAGTAPTATNQVDTDPCIDAWIYGNLIINDGTLSGANSETDPLGYDNTFERARTGTLALQQHGTVARQQWRFRCSPAATTIRVTQQHRRTAQQHLADRRQARHDSRYRHSPLAGAPGVERLVRPSGNTVQVTGAPH